MVSFTIKILLFSILAFLTSSLREEGEQQLEISESLASLFLRSVVDSKDTLGELAIMYYNDLINEEKINKFWPTVGMIKRGIPIA